MVLGMLVGLAGVSNGVEVSLDRDRVSVGRGDRFTVESRITNRGAEPTVPLKAHLNVASLSGAVSVDPEDWSDSPIVDLPALAPGASTSLSWDLKAGDIGSFALYVVVLAPGSVASSAPANVEAFGHETVGAAATLPFVVGIPVMLGLAAGAARWRFRRVR